MHKSSCFFGFPMIAWYSMKELKFSDKKVLDLIKKEEKRQQEDINLIPSENYVSKAVREATASVFTNKYSEGYPYKRYYAGNKWVDEIETLAIERAKKLFGVKFVNVQGYSGSPANLAIYFALLNPGDSITGLYLPHGGHLTHGWDVNFSAKYYKPVQYTVDLKTERIDYENLRKITKKHKPKMIWVGATAYPRIFEWEKFQKISKEIGAYLIADISHIAGLIIAGVHPSPVGIADVIMTTTHKTLRGPRGAMIMTNDVDIAKKIDRAIFPGLQGGPHDHTTAAIAVALKEASTPQFKKYGVQIVKNAKVLAETLSSGGLRLVSGGTDNHLILIDLGTNGPTGKDISLALEECGIITNKNTVPSETRKPFVTSGIRLGTPAVTTRGMKEKEMKKIGGLIVKVINNISNQKIYKEVKKEVLSLTSKFLVP